MIAHLPPDWHAIPVAEQLRVLEAVGLSPLEARAALLPRLLSRVKDELDACWRLAPGIYREKRLEAARLWWTDLWSRLRYALEEPDHAEALRLIDDAVARVSPPSHKSQPRAPHV